MASSQEPEAVTADGCGDTGPEERKRKWSDAGVDAQTLDNILRMNGLGMRTSLIAQALGIAEENVVAALLKRRRIGEREPGGDAGATSGSDQEADTAEAVPALLDRLLTDPLNLCCPILHSLMEDPVVAEDGATYEREAIAAHLQTRTQSPMTGQEMGQHVNPNQGIKSQCIDFKEKTVDEIISVVPRLASGDASKLLKRAEEFTRPGLPESSARRKLLEILQLRSQLPVVLRGSAVKEMVNLCMDGSDDAPFVGFLDRFETLGLGALLSEFDENIIRRLRKVASTAGAHSMTACRALVDKELCRRLASRAGADPQIGKELWELSFLCATAAESDDWIDIAAAVLAMQFAELSLDLASVTNDAVLKRAVYFMRNPSDLERRSDELLGSRLNSTSGMQRPALGQLLSELARRQTSDEEALGLLVEAHDADPECSDVRGRLVALSTEALKSGDYAKESILLTLLLEDQDAVPQELLPHLRIESAYLQSVPPASLLKLAEQLVTAGRGSDGALAAVAAAKVHDASGDADAAQQAYVRAYSMDRTNEAAAHGVVGSCVAATRLCQEMQETCKRQEEIIKRLEEKCKHQEEVSQRQGETLQRIAKDAQQSVILSSGIVEWNLSHISTAIAAPAGHRSPKFNLFGSGIHAHLLFHHSGNRPECADYATVALHLSAPAAIDFTAALDGIEKETQKRYTKDTGDWGWTKFCRKKDSYGKLTLTVHELRVETGPHNELETTFKGPPMANA